MQRFLVEIPLGENTLEIHHEDIVHQILRVMRGKIGDTMIFFCGDTYEYSYCLAEIRKKSIVFSFLEKEKNTHDPAQKIILWQALPNKHEKLEYIVQKGVETGISEFHFFRSERSQDLFMNAKKQERLQSIAKEALEQSLGNAIPKIFFEKETPKNLKNTLVLHTSPQSQKSPLPLWEKEVSFFVGPEGGFSEKEVLSFQERWAKIISFPGRILRTETAGSAMSFLLQNYTK